MRRLLPKEFPRASLSYFLVDLGDALQIFRQSAWRIDPVELLGATSEELAVHPAQKRIIDAMRRRVSEHRVHAAGRAQRGLTRIDPRLDRQRRERSKTEEAAAAGTGLDLRPMLRRVLVGLGELRSDRWGRSGFGRCGDGHRHDGLQRSGGRGYHALVGHAYEPRCTRPCQQTAPSSREHAKVVHTSGIYVLGESSEDRPSPRRVR